MMEKGDASLAALKAAGTRDKKSPLVLADEDVGEGAFFSAGGDHHRDAGARGHPGGSQLGLHAADGGGARCAASQFLDVGIDLLDDRERAWLFLPKVFHQAIDGGEDDEQVGRQHVSRRPGAADDYVRLPPRLGHPIEVYGLSGKACGQIYRSINRRRLLDSGILQQQR